MVGTADQARLVEAVTRELRALAMAGASPWASFLGEAPPCFGCGERGRCAVVCGTSFREIVASGADRVGATLGVGEVPQDLAGYIDHTLLKPEATAAEVQKLCDEAAKYHFKSVCINPFWVPLAKAKLRGSGVLVCTVIGFPLGATNPKVKAMETRSAIEEGADEVDMVINVGALKSGLHDLVEEDIRAVVDAAGRQVVTKVILETALLNEDEKIKGCELSKKARADFVKTSTGFSTGGATAADIALMRRIVGEGMGVKASGGVRTKDDALKMIKAGASRIGASASVKIVSGEGGTGAGY